MEVGIDVVLQWWSFGKGNKLDPLLLYAGRGIFTCKCTISKYTINIKPQRYERRPISLDDIIELYRLRSDNGLFPIYESKQDEFGLNSSTSNSFAPWCIIKH